jgi:hypothetical protein
MRLLLASAAAASVWAQLPPTVSIGLQLPLSDPVACVSGARMNLARSHVAQSARACSASRPRHCSRVSRLLRPTPGWQYLHIARTAVRFIQTTPWWLATGAQLRL